MIRRPKQRTTGLLQVLCWLGLLLSMCLLGLSVWLYFTMDPLLGIAFVLLTGLPGLLLGLACLEYLATGRFTGGWWPF